MGACDFLISESADAVRPIIRLAKSEFKSWLAEQPASVTTWTEATRFSAEPGTICLLPGYGDAPLAVLLGAGNGDALWEWAALVGKLPEAPYRIQSELAPDVATAAALGWALATYRFTRYRTRPNEFPSLVWPENCDRASVERTVKAMFYVRDLINTPADDMTPADVSTMAYRLASRHDAEFSEVLGDQLLARNYPAIHAIGRAAPEPPRLLDLVWGNPNHPKVTLVGKGVCFDSGGFDLKTAAGMKLMKKDMAGAAIVLGVAQMVMSAELPVRLRVLIPAVENTIGPGAIRPLDVVPSRKGVTIEIGNTDAEGRVILADALFEASSEKPDLLIDCATLTGAARVALGVEIPALFSHDDKLASDLMAIGQTIADPMWRLPLWRSYRRFLDGKTADLTNAPEHGFAGAILAALFLSEFVDPSLAWAHLDLMAWNLESRPGRPEGGEAMGMRAIEQLIRDRFAS